MKEEKIADLLSIEELAPSAELADKILKELDKILLGRSELHRMVLIGILSQGHLLFEGVPGVGKTALVKTLGRIMGLQFKRVQFTPDLMPGDILGAHILQENEAGKREMLFQPGPVFTNILLADEINRASPKTQSALLEAMQEHSVTLLGETREIQKPFFVMASQNPIELEGTYPLPEAQIDRFLFKLAVSNVNADVLNDIIGTRRRGELPMPEWTISGDELGELFDAMGKIYLSKPVSRYISRLVAATHPGSSDAVNSVNDYVSYGASPRAAIGIAEAARGNALLEKRPTVGFEDVKIVAPAVLNHRILVNYKSRFDNVDSYSILNQLLESIDEAELSLPDDIEIVEQKGS